MNVKISERLEQSTLQIYERLYKIAESATLDELNEKINTVMDALGLEHDDKTEQPVKETPAPVKEEPVEDEVETEEVEQTPAGTETEDTFTVEESKKSSDETKVEVSEDVDNNTPKKAYSISIHRDIPGFDAESENMEFDSINELLQFVHEKLPVRLSYIEEEQIISNSRTDTGAIIFSNIWFDVIKNADNNEG